MSWKREEKIDDDEDGDEHKVLDWEHSSLDAKCTVLFMAFCRKCIRWDITVKPMPKEEQKKEKEEGSSSQEEGSSSPKPRKPKPKQPKRFRHRALFLTFFGCEFWPKGLFNIATTLIFIRSRDANRSHTKHFGIGASVTHTSQKGIARTLFRGLHTSSRSEFSSTKGDYLQEHMGCAETPHRGSIWNVIRATDAVFQQPVRTPLPRLRPRG